MATYSAETGPHTAVKRARVADQIIGTLRDRILSNGIPSGSRLPTERELATEFGVSGPTVRESLRALTWLGLVEVRHGSGAYIRTDSDAILSGPLAMLMQLESVSLDEVMGLIQVLNLYAADLAVESATDEDIALVREAAERSAQCNSLNDAEQAGIAFLVALSDASHHPLVAALCRFLTSLLIRLETSVYTGKDDSFWQRANTEVVPLRVAIADALTRRDHDDIRVALTALHDKVRERLSEVPLLRNARLSDPVLSSLMREPGGPDDG
jgi:GntR family transcriptional repressor for pyruvate dehydrogenase complex